MLLRRVITALRTCSSNLNIDSCDKPSWVKSSRIEYFECFLSVQVLCIKFDINSFHSLLRTVLRQHSRISRRHWMVQYSGMASNEMPQKSVSVLYLVEFQRTSFHQRPFTPVLALQCRDTCKTCSPCGRFTFVMTFVTGCFYRIWKLKLLQ